MTDPVEPPRDQYREQIAQALNTLIETTPDDDQRSNIDAYYRELADGVLDVRDAEMERLRAEVDRLNSWEGMMSVLDADYPPDVFVGTSGDPGPRIVVLTRALSEARAENGRQFGRAEELQAALRERTQQCNARDAELETLREWLAMHGRGEIVTKILRTYANKLDEAIAITNDDVNQILIEVGRDT